MLTCLVPVLFTFYIQGVLKLRKNNSGAKGLIQFDLLMSTVLLETCRSTIINVLYNVIIHQVCYLPRLIPGCTVSKT